ncbi:MAG: polysaccharide biosynthesis tyrosine autokinase, partial [Terriglobia bacterium]
AEPVRPRPVLYTIAAIAAGLFLGVIVAFVVENMDDTLVTSLEVEEIVGIPVLASIPEFDAPSNAAASKEQPNAAEDPKTRISSWLVSAPRSQAAEAFRVLRTALLLSQPGSPPRVILVASSLSSEGKSTTAYNLATSFALLGKKVLAIDADLRKPAFQRFIGYSSPKGLSNLLTSTESLHEVLVQDPDTPSLSVLPAGAIPPNPSELLISDAFDRLITKCSEEFDVVVIDSPPSLMVTDAAIISRKADGVVLIARSSQTTRSALKRTVQIIRRNKATILGVVLNAVNTSSSEYYYEQGYYGYEGKGYYGSDQS